MPISLIGSNSLANSSITSAKLGYSGAILQTITATYDAQISLTNSAGGQASSYGLPSGRAYTDLVSISITPKFSNSKLMFFCHSGHTAISTSTNNLCQWGIVLVKDNTTGYQCSDYPWYTSGGNYAGNTGAYPPDDHLQIILDAGSTSSQTWYLKGYNYSEGNPITTKFWRTSMTVLEVAA